MARDVVDDFLALLHGSDVGAVDGLASKDGVGMLLVFLLTLFSALVLRLFLLACSFF